MDMTTDEDVRAAATFAVWLLLIVFGVLILAAAARLVLWMF